MLGRFRRNLPRLVPLLLLMCLFGLLFSGCETDTPQNTFDAQGEVAEKQRDLFYIAMWPALVIGVLVLSGIVLLALRFREKDPNGPPPKQIHGNNRLEIAWTIAPAVLLLGMGIPMVAMIYDLDGPPDDNAYPIDVVGQRYSWEFQYPEERDAQGNPLSVQTLLDDPHIPTGRQVYFRLRSVDVIHSFWLPKLGGKRDVFPCPLAIPDPDAAPTPKFSGFDCEGGHGNSLWLVADDPQVLHGQCAEYCGLDHANMELTVVADDQTDFDAWVEEMQAGGPPGSDGDAEPTEPTATATPSAGGG